MKSLALTLLALAFPLLAFAHKGHAHAAAPMVKDAHVTPGTQWAGKTVAYLGDSMTDPRNNSAKLHYWDYLDSLMGIRPVVFARSGYQWDGIYKKALELNQTASPDSIDAIFIWAGTNDYNHSLPTGQFYTERLDSVVFNGVKTERKHREFCMDSTTFCGNINRTLHFLKTHYPTKQIVVLTPIHRAYARFNDKNIQPDENYANGQGLYIEDYIDILKRGAQLWSVPVIDLYGLSGLMPVLPEHSGYFHCPPGEAGEYVDLLHPNEAGHYRLARTIQMQLLGLPPTF